MNSHRGLSRRSFASFVDKIASVFTGQPTTPASALPNTDTSCIISSILQSTSASVISKLQLKRAGLEDLGKPVEPFTAFAARFADQHAARGQGEASVSGQILGNLTHEERVLISDGTFHGSMVPEIADRLKVSRLSVVNALMLYEIRRQWAERMRRRAPGTKLSEEDENFVMDRVRAAARKLLAEAYAEDGVMPIIAHPRFAFLLANRDAPMTFMPPGFRGKTGQDCGLGGMAVQKETVCPSTGAAFAECCGKGLRRLPEVETRADA